MKGKVDELYVHVVCDTCLHDSRHFNSRTNTHSIAQREQLFSCTECVFFFISTEQV